LSSTRIERHEMMLELLREIPVRVLWIVGGLLALTLFLYVVMIFNNLIRLKVNIGKAWANIDVLLKQRHDEVPNLVAVVQGVKEFEQKVLVQLTEARTQALAAGSVREKGKADAAMDSALHRLFAVAENYPKLRAQENFLQLQRRLSEIEDTIADRRTFYNDSVASYNSRIGQFPDVLLASPLGFKAWELFKVEEREKAPVKVGFTQ
jgi:LemA protein